MPTTFAPSTTGKWRNPMLVHELLGVAHARLRAAGDDVARHEIANAPLDEPGAFPGEGAHDVTLRDDADQRSMRVDDRHRADVERAQPRRECEDQFFGNAGRQNLPVRLKRVGHFHDRSPDVRRARQFMGQRSDC